MASTFKGKILESAALDRLCLDRVLRCVATRSRWRQARIAVGHYPSSTGHRRADVFANRHAAARFRNRQRVSCDHANDDPTVAVVPGDHEDGVNDSAAVRLIRRNFRVSLCYNILAMSMAIFGVINPLIAAILMPISSLTIFSLTLAAKPFGDSD